MFICEIWLFVWYFPQFCTSDMSKYRYLEVFQRVPSTVYISIPLSFILFPVGHGGFCFHRFCQLFPNFLHLLLRDNNYFELQNKRHYRIYPAIRQDFCPSRMTSN